MIFPLIYTHIHITSSHSKGEYNHQQLRDNDIFMDLLADLQWERVWQFLGSPPHSCTALCWSRAELPVTSHQGLLPLPCLQLGAPFGSPNTQSALQLCACRVSPYFLHSDGVSCAAWSLDFNGARQQQREILASCKSRSPCPVACQYCSSENSPFFLACCYKQSLAVHNLSTGVPQSVQEGSAPHRLLCFANNMKADGK